MFETLIQDVRHGFRMLIKNPGFSLVAIASIAVGVAVCAAMFSVADGLVLRPLPVPRGGEVVTINGVAPNDGGRGTGLSYLAYRELRDTAWDADVAGLLQRLEEILKVPAVQPPGKSGPSRRWIVPGAIAVVVFGFAMWWLLHGSAESPSSSDAGAVSGAAGDPLVMAAEAIGLPGTSRDENACSWLPQHQTFPSLAMPQLL